MFRFQNTPTFNKIVRKLEEVGNTMHARGLLGVVNEILNAAKPPIPENHRMEYLKHIFGDSLDEIRVLGARRRVLWDQVVDVDRRLINIATKLHKEKPWVPKPTPIELMSQALAKYQTEMEAYIETPGVDLPHHVVWCDAHSGILVNGLAVTVPQGDAIRRLMNHAHDFAVAYLERAPVHEAYVITLAAPNRPMKMIFQQPVSLTSLRRHMEGQLALANLMP